MAQIWLKLWHFPQAMAQTIALRLQWFQTLNDKVWAEQIQVPSCYNGSQRCRLIFFLSTYKEVPLLAFMLLAFVCTFDAQ
jgi:hypothetical protein